MEEKFIFITPEGEKVYITGLLEKTHHYTAYYAIMGNKNVVIEFPNAPTSWTYSITF